MNIHLWMFVATVNVYVPKDRVTNLHQGYGFVEFRSEEDADYVSIYLFVTLRYCWIYPRWIGKVSTYVDISTPASPSHNFWTWMQAIKILNMIKLYGKPIRVNKVYISLYSVIFKLDILSGQGKCPQKEYVV